MSRKAVVSVSLVGLAAWLGTCPCSAEWVDVSADGVHVRAPYVSVDVYPGGSVSVRAPYASVNIGHPHYGGSPSCATERPVARAPLPSRQELAGMDDDALRQAIQAISDQLRSSLTQYKTGYLWQRYLQSPDVDSAGVGESSNAYRNAIGKLLDRLNRVSADARYRKLTQSPEFVAMRDALMEAHERRLGDPSSLDGRAEELPIPPQESQPTQP